MYSTFQNRSRHSVILVATGISTLFNPLFIIIPLFYVLTSANPDSTRQFAIAIVFFSLIPLLILILLKGIQKIETLEVRKQHNRHLPFILGLCPLVAGYLVLVFLYGGTGIVQAAGFAIAGSSGIAALINLKWKISIHCMAVAIASVFLLYVLWASISPQLFIAILTLSILLKAGMMWSRVALGAHSLPQTFSGILFGLFFGLSILLTYSI